MTTDRTYNQAVTGGKTCASLQFCHRWRQASGRSRIRRDSVFL